MRYLIIFKDDEGETRELFEDSDSTARFIETLLRDKKLAQSDIELFQLDKVDYQVEHVPVVSLEGSDSGEPAGSDETAADDVFSEMKTVENSNDSDNLEVFTFDS